MHVYILFAHPSEVSFNREVLDAFARGLRDAGHTYEIGDLYRMGFASDMDLEQYGRPLFAETSFDGVGFGLGFSVVDEALERGLRAIAVPILSSSGRLIAGLNLSTNATRTPRERLREKFLPPLRKAAEQIGDQTLAVHGQGQRLAHGRLAQSRPPPWRTA